MANDTAPEKNDKAVKRNEAELAAIYENAPLMMMLVNQDRRVLKANKAVLNSANREIDDIIGLRGGEALRCIHRLDNEQGCGFGLDCERCGVRNTVLDTFKNNTPYHRREATVVLDRDGPVPVHMLVSTSPLEIEGEPLVLVCLEDVTERRHAQDELRRSEEKHRNLFENLIDVYQQTDRDGIISMVSPSCERIFGYTQEEAVGTYIKDYYLHPEERETFLETLLKNGQVGNYRIQVKKKDGTVVWVSTNAKVLRDEKGAFAGVEAVSRDISERKKIEEEREELIGELQDALKNIKTLSGLLPMCARCKKIRDDKGYWNRLEVYLKDHSDADFSHGICPDCKEDLYGDRESYRPKPEPELE